jgi:23S rRNA (adenine-N6)-dimethyltransferase
MSSSIPHRSVGGRHELGQNFLVDRLAQRAWSTAVLLPWEVARKRAAVGGTTLLTASWWPWYEFALAGRVPSTAFRPRPGVDGGILVVGRRPVSLVDPSDRAATSTWCARRSVVTGYSRHCVGCSPERGGGSPSRAWPARFGRET